MSEYGGGVRAPAARSAAPVLLKGLRDADPMVRLWSASALNKMRRHLEDAIGVLADLALVDDWGISCAALLQLMMLGQEAKAAVPVLLKLLESSKPESREWVKTVLKAIDPAAAAKAGLQ